MYAINYQTILIIVIYIFFILAPLQGQNEENTNLIFINNGKKYLNKKDYSMAKESFRTAIKINPADLVAWELYDQTLELAIVEKVRTEDEKTTLIKKYAPEFELCYVNSYKERGTLVIFGTVKNLSERLQKKLNIEIILFDSKEKALQRKSTKTSLGRLGIPAKSKDNFEVKFSPIPFSFHKYQVKLLPGYP
ncbi:hypothetical protein ACFL35_03745 [Candidatus Riflebacteria bacterium]